MNKEITKQIAADHAALMGKLRIAAPHINFVAEWTPSGEAWDGDRECKPPRGYISHDVEVRVTTIVAGKEYVGRNYLGSCWDRPGKECPDMHGYFVQMAQEALKELHDQITETDIVNKEVSDAMNILNVTASERYMAQRAELEGKGVL